MNKIVLATLLALMTLSFSACDSAKQKLQKTIEDTNKKYCPIDMGMIGELSSITYDSEESEVVMTMTIKKDIPVKLSALNQLKQTLKRLMLSNWNKEDDIREIFEDIAEADSKLCIVMQNADESDKLKIDISENEIKYLASGKVYSVTPHEELELTASITNAQCPMQVDEMTILSSAAIEGSNLVYNYSFDESIVDIDTLQENVDILKESTKQNLLTDDPSMKSLITICKNAHANIVYRYVGDQSGKVCQFMIYSSEL